MSEPRSICALCRVEAELCDSHVIPKFTHRRIKEHDGTIAYLSQDSHPDGDVVQDVFWERLFCSDCEARFQKWEDHAARMINQRKVFDFPPTLRGQFQTLSGFNYEKMKLFLLSVLWRMHVARDEAFARVRLGRHADRIRCMLLRSDPGEVTDYGIAVTVVHIDGERIELTRPADAVRLKRPKLAICRSLVDGLLFQWLVGSRSKMREFKTAQLLLQTDGTWMTYSRHWRDVDFIRDEIDRLLERSNKE